MFQASVPDKLIQQQTGHRSLPVLHHYERNSEAQLLDISNVLSNHEGSSTLSNIPGNQGSGGENDRSAYTEMVAYDSAVTSAHRRDSVICKDQLVTPQCLPPPPPTFVFNSCNFSSCPISFPGSSHQDNTGDIDELLKGISMDQLFDP